jgi:hypothetical protein
MGFYGNFFKYSDGKLRMGPSKSSCQSSRVPKKCGRASEVWSGARSALLTLGFQRAQFGRSARSKITKRLTIFEEAEEGVKYRAGCAQCKWAGCVVCRAAMEAHKGSKGR